MQAERRRIEREWIEARTIKSKLQGELRRARRAGLTDPAAAPAPDLLQRYEDAKHLCRSLDSQFFTLLGLEHYDDTEARRA